MILPVTEQDNWISKYPVHFNFIYTIKSEGNVGLKNTLKHDGGIYAFVNDSQKLTNDGGNRNSLRVFIHEQQWTLY